MTTHSDARPLALAYVRVSTLDQAEEGASLAAQETALTAEAKRRGWDVEIVREEGKSAKSIEGRAKLRAAIDRLNSGGADYLLCVRLDRLSRSVGDFANLVEDARRKGWGLVLQSPNIDLTDPAGEFTANVLASAAQYERRLISARTREGMAQRKSEGVHLGRKAEEVMLPAYRRVLNLKRDGLSLRAIAAQLTTEGVATATGRKWHASTVRAMLNSETLKTFTVSSAIQT